MTIFGADWSNHDWGRGPMDVAAAVRDGISFATHKVAEGSPGWYVDPYFDDWWARARGVVPLLGAYYVNHPGDQISQADFFLSQLDSRAPGWRDGPFILQVDAEKFDYMSRAPSLAEIRAFCDRLVSRTGGRYRPVVYAPGWLYGNTLAGLGYPLWESDYGTNPTVHYRSAYPGDSSSRWGAYSGQTPALLQYGSRTTIGTQTICDANAFRGTLAQLTALVTPGDDDMNLTDPLPSPKEVLATGEVIPAASYNVAERLAWAHHNSTAAHWTARAALAAAKAADAKAAEILKRMDALEAKLADPVDEAALAQQLAPLLQQLGPGATVEEIAQLLASVRLTAGT